jgi:hypothetical protein
MGLDWVKEYLLFIVLAMVCLMLFPPFFAQFLSGVLGTYASYGATALVLAIVLWLYKRFKKAV